MDHELVNIFNHVGLGTFFLVFGFIVASVAFIIKNATAITKKYKQKVMDEADKTESFSKLVKSVDNLNAKIKKLDTRLNCTDAIINKLEKANRVNTERINDNIIPSIQKMDYVIDDVVNSNNASIRSFIVNEYHKWMKLGYIDIYSFSVIQDRYEFYSRHNGNSFVKSLVEQLDKLPVKSVVTDENGNDPVSYFNDNPNMHPSIRHNQYQEKHKDDDIVTTPMDDMPDNCHYGDKISNTDVFNHSNIDNYYDGDYNYEVYDKKDEE